MSDPFDIFLVAPPGLERALLKEVSDLGFSAPKRIKGGVEITGDWRDVMRANLQLRGAVRVLARIGSFRAFHLAQLDKRARKFNWGAVLRPDVPVRVETVTNRKSKIYHAGAATERVERAISETLGAPISADAPVTLKLRIDDNLCVFSVDTSGESLHKRGHKQGVGKAPMRENLAALFLRECGYNGDEPVYDPMCGSGTFVIEAAEIAMGLNPGRSRNFAFEQLATFEPAVWRDLKASQTTRSTKIHFIGSDRNEGAITMSVDNAQRAGVADVTRFTQCAVSDAIPPDGAKGLVIVNPPYGTRIGNKKLLFALYSALGDTIRDRFKGWRVGIVTSDSALAQATGLDLKQGPVVPHGGLKIRLYSCET